MPKKKPKLTTEELLGIIEAHRTNAIGALEGSLSNERSEALKRYLGEPYGDEVEGRSQVISKDLAETIDWIMPSLLRVFLLTNDFVRFDPVGPEDVDAAQQQTDYVNYVIMKENNGFMLFYDWFKDALLLKNGYVKRWWEETEKATHETYQVGGEDELLLLLQSLESSGDTIEVVGQEQIEGHYKIKIRRTAMVGRVRIEGIPPEELRIASGTRGNLQESRLVEHETKKTRSQLIEMGMDEEFVYSLPAWSDVKNTDALARNSISDEDNRDMSSTSDESTTEIEYCEAWLRVDFDNDGLAELRRVVVVGGTEIPSGDEWNMEVDEIPISYLTPNRLPHRHIGLSMQDELEQLAGIKTALTRALLDNTYQQVHQEFVINERAHKADFLTSSVYGMKRVKGRDPVEGSVMPLIKPSILQHVLPVLDYVDSVNARRTGVDKNVVGLDPDTLSKTTDGASRRALQQANAKIEMIARLYAETGVKDLALAVHALLIKHQDKPKIAKLRNEWIPVNPSEWKTRTDMTVNVGLGNGSHEEVRGNLMLMSQMQAQFKQDGIVLPKNSYALAEKLSDQLGFKEKGLFFSDPDGEEMKTFLASRPPPPPDPLIVMEQIKAQSKQQSDMLKVQMEKAKSDLDHQHKMHELEKEVWEFRQTQALAVAKEEITAMIAGMNVDLGAPGVGAELQDQPAEPEIPPEPAQPSQLEQAMAMLMQQSQQTQAMIQNMLETMARPRKISVNRGKDGRATDAISMLQ